MTVSTYQIHNVLRAYGKQLSQTKRLSRTRTPVEPNRPDQITISAQARRKAVIDKVSSDIVNRIVQEGPRDEIEREVFHQLETEYGDRLTVDKKGSELLFKVIDKDNGEVTKVLSNEDSQILQDRLAEITKNRVNNNMIS